MKKVRISDFEKFYVKENYATKTAQEIADVLEVRIGRVYRIAEILGIKKPLEAISQRAKENYKMSEKWLKPYQFKKGVHVWNTGTKGLTTANKTSFKKGQLPHNTLFDGAISIRFHKKHECWYQFIRVGKNKWELLHRFNYSDFYGEIPAKHVVRFMDGNTLNCEPENLIAIPIELHMRLNSVTRFPDELRKLIRLKALLSKKINKIKTNGN